MEVQERVVIIHGFMMKAPIMRLLQHRLQEQGFHCLSISYATYWRTLAENIECQLPQIQRFAQGGHVHYIGHSLGGLFIRHLRARWPQGFASSRVVTLGTPHCGCSVADYFAAKGWENKVLRGAYRQALDGLAPAWPSEIPLLSIAGSNPYSLGMVRLLTGVKISDPINDGVVGYCETLLPQAQASLLLNETHLSMLYSARLIAPITRWLCSASV